MPKVNGRKSIAELSSSAELMKQTAVAVKAGRMNKYGASKELGAAEKCNKISRSE
jgi:hypothetical protein